MAAFLLHCFVYKVTYVSRKRSICITPVKNLPPPGLIVVDVAVEVLTSTHPHDAM